MLSVGRALLLGVALVPAQATAVPVELLSHRAAYRLSLADRDGGSGAARAEFQNVRGALVMEWRASCEGWLSTQQLGFIATTAEGPDVSYDVRFSSWESPDNTRLRFSIRSFDGGALSEEFRGQAELEGPGGAGQVRYAVPAESTLELPSGTVFPTEHLRRLIAAARDGQRFVAHEVFDGSGPEALTRVTAVIGPPRTAGADGDKDDSARHWPVTLAYYPLTEADETPQFELAFELGEDGVLHDVLLDYGNFALRAHLEQVERFAPPRCD
jgi:hypothetical protein